MLKVLQKDLKFWNSKNWRSTLSPAKSIRNGEQLKLDSMRNIWVDGWIILEKKTSLWSAERRWSPIQSPKCVQLKNFFSSIPLLAQQTFATILHPKRDFLVLYGIPMKSKSRIVWGKQKAVNIRKFLMISCKDLGIFMRQQIKNFTNWLDEISAGNMIKRTCILNNPKTFVIWFGFLVFA